MSTVLPGKFAENPYFLVAQALCLPCWLAD
jgi:hypothetical protein